MTILLLIITTILSGTFIGLWVQARDHLLRTKKELEKEKLRWAEADARLMLICEGMPDPLDESADERAAPVIRKVRERLADAKEQIAAAKSTDSELQAKVFEQAKLIRQLTSKGELATVEAVRSVDGHNYAQLLRALDVPRWINRADPIHRIMDGSVTIFNEAAEFAEWGMAGRRLVQNKAALMTALATLHRANAVHYDPAQELGHSVVEALLALAGREVAMRTAEVGDAAPEGDTP